MNLMKLSALTLAIAAGTTQLAFASAQSESNGFVEDASLNLLLRNTYWNRDYKNGVPDRKTWAQGFIGTFESGFTQGTVGVGVDAFGLLGIKLDGGQPDMFPFSVRKNKYKDSTSQAGAAVKARISNTVIKYGDQMPNLPVLSYDDTRLLPESFTGTLITSNEIEGLELNAGYFTADSSMESGARDSLHLKRNRLAGGTYQFNDNVSASLYYADIEDSVTRKYGNLNWNIPLSEARALNFDFNIYKSNYDKQLTGTSQDNTIFSLAGKYSFGGQALILAYQQNTGDTGYYYGIGDGGGAIWLANSFYSDFNAKDERSWQASYEVDFAEYGVPGLSWKTAYIYGYDINMGHGVSDAKEREIFNQVKYTIQDGYAKDLSFKARNSIYRSSNSYSADLNEWRLFVEYPLNIL